MEKILVINASPIMKEKSDSWAMSQLFISEYSKTHQVEIIELDLNELPMASKTISTKTMPNYFNQEDSFDLIDQLKAVDKLVINMPMINWGVSAMLKNYIDHITLANQTFTYKGSTDGSPIGLLTNLKVQLLGTKGGFGTSNSAFVDYVKEVWTYLGSEVTEPIVNDQTDLPPYNTMIPLENLERVKDQIIAAVKKF